MGTEKFKKHSVKPATTATSSTETVAVVLVEQKMDGRARIQEKANLTARGELKKRSSVETES